MRRRVANFFRVFIFFVADEHARNPTEKSSALAGLRDGARPVLDGGYRESVEHGVAATGNFFKLALNIIAFTFKLANFGAVDFGGVDFLIDSVHLAAFFGESFFHSLHVLADFPNRQLQVAVINLQLAAADVRQCFLQAVKIFNALIDDKH